MKKKSLFISVIVVILGAGYAIYFFLNQQPSRKDFTSLNLLDSAVPHVSYKGYASDGDDQTTGVAKEFRFPNRAVSDGGSRSEGRLKDNSRVLEGVVVAEKGSQSEMIGYAFLEGEEVIPFQVSGEKECRYLVESLIETSFDEGAGKYLFSVKILNEEGAVVPGSEYTMSYSLMKDPKNRISLSSEGGDTERFSVDRAIRRLDVSSKPLMLKAGEYAISVKMQLDTLATKRAELKVLMDFDLI